MSTVDEILVTATSKQVECNEEPAYGERLCMDAICV